VTSISYQYGCSLSGFGVSYIIVSLGAKSWLIKQKKKKKEEKKGIGLANPFLHASFRSNYHANYYR
jgi:hypothetical protein